MAAIYTCDNCGDKMKRSEICQVHVYIQNGKQPQPHSDSYAAILGLTNAPRHDDFMFCGECAAMLVLAIKSGQVRRKKGLLVD